MKRNKRMDESEDAFLECVWMLAGVLDFKLCDREYECENCPLDQGLRQSAGRRAAMSVTAGSPEVERQDREEAVTVRGNVAPASLFYDPRHVWLRVEDKGRVRIGLDDFGQRLTGRIYSVVLPTPGTVVDRDSRDWRIIHRAGQTALTIPVGGIVEEVNERLLQQPSLMNRDPYKAGAALVIRPFDLSRDLNRLYYGERVEGWYEDETQGLHSKLLGLLERHTPGLGQTLQDGGVHIADLSADVDVEELQNLIDQFLSVSAGPCAAGQGTDSDAGGAERRK